MVVAEQWEVVNVIQEGHRGFAGQPVPSPLQKYALSLMFRFCQQKTIPKDITAFQAAAAYIATRDPLSYPNRVAKEEFAEQFAVREASLEWHLKQIVSALEFMVLRDDEHFPYYMDPRGAVWRLTQALVEAEVTEMVTGALVGQGGRSKAEVIADITAKIVSKVNAVPVQLAASFKDLVAALVEVEFDRVRPYIRYCGIYAT
jgi:hypothetical protein